MKKIFLAVATALAMFSCSQKEPVTVTITNPLSIDRNGEMVEISMAEITGKLQLPDTAQVIVLDENGLEVWYNSAGSVCMGCQESWRPVHVYEQKEMEGRITLGFNKKKDQNYLEKVPVRNPEFSWKEDQQGIVTVDMMHKGIFDKLAQKLWVTPRVSHVKLDRFGSFVWKQMDGNRNIIAIGALVREEFGDQAEPLYERLAKFVKMLRDNRFVIFGK